MVARTEQRIVICTLIACALSCALPAAAAERGPLTDTSDLYAGMAGQPLGDEELGAMRGRYLPPPGSTVIIQIGNGDNTSTTYSQSNPATPGSATVTTTGNTTVTGHASTGVGGSGSISRSFSFGSNVGTSYGTHH